MPAETYGPETNVVGTVRKMTLPNGLSQYYTKQEDGAWMENMSGHVLPLPEGTTVYSAPARIAPRQTEA